MKKILHISNYYPPNIGGIETTAKDIVEVLKEKYKQRVICFNSIKGESKEELCDGILVSRVAYNFKKASQAISLSYRSKLKKIINDFKPDFIHIHLPNPFVAIILQSIKYRGELIIHWHLDITRQKFINFFYKPFQNSLLKRANLIIATSQRYLDGSANLKKYKYKTVIVPSLIHDSNTVLSKENKENIKIIKEKYKKKFIGFFVGRHVKYKGLEYLIEAAKLLNDDYVILIAGEGKLTEKLKKQAEGIARIIFLGKIKYSELKEYMNACDVFLFPSISKNEAYGLALGEALLCGKPAITFTIEGSGVNWVNQNGITGEEVKNKDVIAYKNAIIKLKEDKELYKKYSKNAILHVKNHMLKDSFEKALRQIYKDL